MHLRKSLVTAAAIVAAGLIGLSTAAFAASLVTIGGNSSYGTDTMNGQFKSGTASFAGSTYGCTTGTLTASMVRGPIPTAGSIVFNSLNISCSTPVGAATISLNSCTVTVDYSGATATAGVDTAVSPGSAAFGTGTCVKVSALFGLCTAYVQGTVGSAFNETVKTGGWQDVILYGSGTLAGASSGCSGLLTGTFTLNNMDFNIKANSGPINFS